MALATCWMELGTLNIIRVIELFVAISMCVLAIMKLRDLSSFTTGFVQYDMVAKRYVPYGYFYPFVEGGAGALMIAGLLTWFAAPLALIVATNWRDFRFQSCLHRKARPGMCLCRRVGSSVPLGFISLTENLMMIAMSIWMIVKELGLVSF